MATVMMHGESIYNLIPPKQLLQEGWMGARPSGWRTGLLPGLQYGAPPVGVVNIRNTWLDIFLKYRR